MKKYIKLSIYLNFAMVIVCTINLSLDLENHSSFEGKVINNENKILHFYIES